MNTVILNFYMSALRNMFLTSSIAIAMIGFSERFENSRKLIINVIALSVVALSIFFGVKATEDFKLLLKREIGKDGLTETDKLLISQASEWPICAYAYISMLSVIFVSLLIRLINTMM